MGTNQEDKGFSIPHKLVLHERKRLTVSGVSEIASFDDTAVLLHTARGDLLVRGEGLKLKTLSQEGGQVAVEGKVDLMAYEEPRTSGGGFLSRLLGR